eukprot:560987-Amphidinium_carterae.1
MSDAQVVSTRDSPFGVARVFQIATPHQTPVSTPKGNLVSSLGAEFLRGGAVEQAKRDNARMRADLDAVERDGENTRAASVAWAHSQGGNAARVGEVVRRDAEQRHQRIVLNQNE